MVQPKYTSAAMRAKVQGQVVVQAVVGTDGSVEKARVILGLDPDLDEQALIAIRQWSFQPGNLDGRAVPVAVVCRWNSGSTDRHDSDSDNLKSGVKGARGPE